MLLKKQSAFCRATDPRFKEIPGYSPGMECKVIVEKGGNREKNKENRLNHPGGHPGYTLRG